MSVKVMSLVWDNFDRGGSEKLVMLAMADWCSDDGSRLHPSISTVAKKTNISESQARRIIHKFIDEGYLTVTANFNGGDKGQSRHYQLNLNKLLTTSTSATPCIDATPSTDAHEPLAPMRITPSTHDTLTINNHYLEPLTKPLPLKTKSHTSVLDDGFEEFWNRYPKKVGKHVAHTAWKKNKVKVDDVLKTLAWQVHSEQWTKQSGQFIPNPATYINQGRWHDEPVNEGVPF